MGSRRGLRTGQHSEVMTDTERRQTCAEDVIERLYDSDVSVKPRGALSESSGRTLQGPYGTYTMKTYKLKIPSFALRYLPGVLIISVLLVVGVPAAIVFVGCIAGAGVGGFFYAAWREKRSYR